MRLAYLLNSYPMTSTTFIRREIEAIEAAGVPVKRFAVRHWGQKLVDPADQAEQVRTEYLLTRNIAVLLFGLLREMFMRGRMLAPAWAATMALRRASGASGLRPIVYLAEAIRLRRRCADLGIEHLHAHFSTNAAAVAMLCRLLGGPRYSFTVHGPNELVDPEHNALTLKATHAARIVAISHYCHAALKAHLPAELASRIAIVPCGIDLSGYPEAGTSAPAGQDLLCVGRLCPEKGQTGIPAAVAALAGKWPGLRILLIGDGATREAVRRETARLGVEGRVLLMGWRSNAEVRSAIRDARALLVPSYAEGLPIVIMEAFAERRPVIATYVAAIPELVDARCGWLFDAGDAAGLERMIDLALSADEPTLERMGREGRRRVEERHDIAKIAPMLIELFRSADRSVLA